MDAQAMYTALSLRASATKQQNVILKTPNLAPGGEGGDETLTFEAHQVLIRNNMRNMGAPDDVIDQILSDMQATPPCDLCGAECQMSNNGKCSMIETLKG